MAKTDWLYGLHAVQAILERAPERVLEVVLQAERRDQRSQAIYALVSQHGIAHTIQTRQQLDSLTQQASHQGVAARCRLAQALNEDQLEDMLRHANDRRLLLVLDSVTDPHNLGACLRTADAAGVLAVIAGRDKAVGLTPAVRKVAVGAAEVVPFVQVTNLARTLRELKAHGIWVVGTAMESGSRSLFDTDLAEDVALVMGAEGTGLRRLTRETCDELVYIPMAGNVASLNVSVATGICLFEACRQGLAKSAQSA